MPSRTVQFFLSLLVVTSLFVLLTSFQVGYFFEDGVYGKFTLSALLDGDFNILNQEPQVGDHSPRMVTKTGYSTSFEFPAVSSYLAPFYLYQLGVDTIRKEQSPVFTNRFFPAHILSTIFYTLAGTMVLLQLLSEFGFKSTMKPVIIFFFSTPFFYYFTFCSTTVDMFANSYSIFALTIFWLYRDKSVNSWLILAMGVISGFGIAIRIHLLWIFFLYSYFIFFREKKLKNLMFMAAGVIFPLSLMQFNNYMILQKFMLPLQVYVEGYSPIDFVTKTSGYYLFGPNGQMLVSPIYFAVIAGFILILRPRPGIKWIVWSMVVPGAILFFRALSCWVVADEFVGRLQLDYFFVDVILLAALLDWLGSQAYVKRMVIYSYLFACMLWHILVTICFYHVDATHFWTWPNEFEYTFSKINDSISYLRYWFSIKPVMTSLRLLPIYFPLITLISFLLFKLQSWTLRQMVRSLFLFFGLGVLIFTYFTVSNVLRGPSNVSQLRAQNYYYGKMVVNEQHALFYDDYEEEIKKSSYWYLLNNDCDTVHQLQNINSQFLKKVNEAIGSKTKEFQDQILNNPFPPSSSDNPEFLKIFKTEVMKTCQF